MQQVVYYDFESCNVCAQWHHSVQVSKIMGDNAGPIWGLESWTPAGEGAKINLMGGLFLQVGDFFFSKWRNFFTYGSLFFFMGLFLRVGCLFICYWGSFGLPPFTK